MINSSNMNNYAASMSSTNYTPEYIPENGYDFGHDQGLPMAAKYQLPHEGIYAQSTGNIGLQSLSPAYSSHRHFSHIAQYPSVTDTNQLYTYPHEEQQAAWNAQYEAAKKPLNQAPTATKPRQSSYQSSTAAPRARQTSMNSDTRAQHVQQTSGRASPAPTRSATAPKPPQPAWYGPHSAAVPPNLTQASTPRTNLAKQSAVTKAGAKTGQIQSTRPAAKTPKPLSNSATSGTPTGNGGQGPGGYPHQPQDYSYVAPPAPSGRNASQSSTGTLLNPTQHVHQTQPASASIFDIQQDRLVDPLERLHGSNAASQIPTGKPTSDPSPTTERRDAEASGPTTNTTAPQPQQVSFSAAVSKDGLGQVGGLQFWESFDEYLHHSKAISELHEKAKTLAKWVVHHDKELRANDNYNLIDEVDKLLRAMLDTEDIFSHDAQSVKAPQGVYVLRPETIVQHLETTILQLLSEDPERLREFRTPSSTFVEKLKQDATHRQIESHLGRVQALALTVCHIVNGKQDGLVAYATNPRVLEAAKRGMQSSKKGIEAYYRGTASVSQKFCYPDELKNVISATLRKNYAQTTEEVNTDEAWLQAQLAAASALQLRLAVPKIGDLHLAPDLNERTLSYLHDIVYQANEELQRIMNDRPQQNTSLGKHPRTRDDAEKDQDKGMMPPPPAKVQKTTKNPTKKDPPHEPRTKESSTLQQPLSQPGNGKAAGDDDEVFIIGIKPVLNPFEGCIAGQEVVQHTAAEGVTQQAAAKPY